MPSASKKSDDTQYWIPPGPIEVCGIVKYVGGPSSHCWAHMGLVNDEYLALLFPVSVNLTPLLKIKPDERDPSQKYLLAEHLQEPLRDSVHIPFLISLSASFEDPLEEMLETWQVYSGYGTHTDPARIYAFYPPKDWYRPRTDYIFPIKAKMREEKGPFIELEFSSSS